MILKYFFFTLSILILVFSYEEYAKNTDRQGNKFHLIKNSHYSFSLLSPSIVGVTNNKVTYFLSANGVYAYDGKNPNVAMIKSKTSLQISPHIALQKINDFYVLKPKFSFFVYRSTLSYWFFIRAKNALIHKKTHTIVFNKDVHMYSDFGYEFNTAKLNINILSFRMETHKSTTFNNPFTYLVARNGFKYVDLKRKSFLLSDMRHSRLKHNQKDENTKQIALLDLFMVKGLLNNKFFFQTYHIPFVKIDEILHNGGGVHFSFASGFSSFFLRKIFFSMNGSVRFFQGNGGNAFFGDHVTVKFWKNRNLNTHNYFNSFIFQAHGNIEVIFYYHDIHDKKNTYKIYADNMSYSNSKKYIFFFGHVVFKNNGLTLKGHSLSINTTSWQVSIDGDSNKKSNIKGELDIQNLNSFNFQRIHENEKN